MSSFYVSVFTILFLWCSESILLCTDPSPSPLSLLRSGFGSEVSRSLHELKIGGGDLKLSGYICSPFDNFSIKVWLFSWCHKRRLILLFDISLFFISCFYGRVFNMSVSTPFCNFFKSMVIGGWIGFSILWNCLDLSRDRY